MLDTIATALGLPIGGVLLLVGLIAAQLALQIVALVDLARRRHGVRYGRKWVWAIVIVAGNLVGAVLYLALGRSPAPVAEPATGGSSGSGGARAIRELYGDQPDD